jgi:hypothetical protein
MIASANFQWLTCAYLQGADFWGESTSVGSNAIQLAIAAGYDVVTTASLRKFAYVERLCVIWSGTGADGSAGLTSREERNRLRHRAGAR